MTDCEVRGDGRAVMSKSGRFKGPCGILLRADCGAELRNVEVHETSNSGVVVEVRSTLTAVRLTVHHSCSSGLWLDGCLSATLDGCSFHHNALEGFYGDTLQPVVMTGRNKFNHNGDSGLMVTFPYAVVGGLASGPSSPWASAFTTPHLAPNIEARYNARCGVRVLGGVSIDLSDSRLQNNSHCGLRVEHCADGVSTAPITLRGAVISNNGLNREGDAKEEEGDRCGVEKPSWKLERGEWRNRLAADGVHIHGNQGDACISDDETEEQVCIVEV